MAAEVLCLQDDPYTLVIALDAKGTAEGELYADDGKSFAFQRGVFASRRFRCALPVSIAQCCLACIFANIRDAPCKPGSLAHSRMAQTIAGLHLPVMECMSCLSSDSLTQPVACPGCPAHILAPDTSAVPAALWGAPKQMQLL